MTDRINVPLLQKGLSSDHNRSQLMAARVLADILRPLGSLRAAFGAGGGTDEIPRSTTTGLSFRIVGNVITVNPGLLAQVSTTWPAAPGAFESDVRLGMLHVAQNFNFPATPNASCLVEMRVVDVVTNEMVDILDTGTGSFAPSNQPKPIETRIELQFTFGGLAAYPAFIGNPWVPLCIFSTDGAGQFNAAADVWDLRPELNDIIAQLAVHPSSSGAQAVPNATVNKSKMTCLGASIALTTAADFDAEGFLGFGRFWARGVMTPLIDTGVAGIQDVEHVYLAPLLGPGVFAIPKRGTTAGGPTGPNDQAGVLVRAQKQPQARGRQNGTALNLPAPWVNFPAVSVGTAMHVGSMYRSGTGWTPGMQDAQGRYKGGWQDVAARTVLSTGLVNIASLSLTEQTMDMTGLLPANAQTAFIALTVTLTAASNQSAIGIHIYGEDQPAPGAAFRSTPDPNDYMFFQGLASSFLEPFRVILEVPVQTSSPFEAINRRWRVAVGNNSGILIVGVFRAELLGWAY